VLPMVVRDMCGARSSVCVANWFLSPGFRPLRDGDSSTIRSTLGTLARSVDVRVLLWSGMPLPFGARSRRNVRSASHDLDRAGPVRVALDSHERPLHCHHEKLVIVDDRVAYVGGIDFTTLDGDRFDSPVHPPRQGLGWHDLMVRLEGPAVADVADHFRFRWGQVTGERLPPGEVPPPSGDATVQVVRTVPERIYPDCRRGDFRILEAYLRGLRSAERFIYLENQYLWSTEIVEVLADKLRHPPNDDFRLIMVLPSKANTGTDNTLGQLARLAEADDGRGRFLACAISPAGHAVYVHAKVAVVDDRWITVGSANLNEHSLFNDTEMNVSMWDEGIARETRLRLWAEHLEASPGDVGGPPHDVFDRMWRPVADEQLRRLSAGLERTHRLLRLQQVSRRSHRLIGPLQSLFVDG
jgi:phosphatidylserine/phosphatidylglycerophosphate/cardiolipin synthase-like enzyme